MVNLAYNSISGMEKFQMKLSEGQQRPIAGPAFFTPVKAMVTTAQIITSYVLRTFFYLGAVLSNPVSYRLSDAFAFSYYIANEHFKMGCKEFRNCISNAFSSNNNARSSNRVYLALNDI